MKPLVLLSLAGISSAQTISVEQLSHRVPPTAAREYIASTRALSHGDIARSIAHCRKAIETDPDNASAHNDLGVLYLNGGLTEEAMAEFRRANALEPHLLAASVNGSFAALSLANFEEAEQFARAALQEKGTDHRANLLLGWSLVAQHRYTGVALESLQIAAREFPEAKLAIVDVLVHQGSFDRARAEIESYLAGDPAEYKTVAESWLRLLTFQ